jgi:hypothetical protein
LAALSFRMEATVLETELKSKTSRIALPPPPEMADLIQQSYSVFDAVREADRYTADCQGTLDCDDAWFAMYLAAGDLMNVMESWASLGD